MNMGNERLYSSQISTTVLIMSDTAFRAMAAKNPTAAWEQATKLGQRGMSAKSSILSELALHNPTEGLKLVNASKGMFDSWASRSFFQTWAGQDPVAATASLDQVKNAQARSNALNAVAAVWVQRDPAAAMAWADGQTNMRDKQNAIGQILTTQAESDPQGAIATLRTKTLGSNQQYIMSNKPNHRQKRRLHHGAG